MTRYVLRRLLQSIGVLLGVSVVVFFLIRLIYFMLIGWWFSLIWSLLAWLLCVSIIGLPFGVLMFNRLPGVTTLMRH